MAVIRLTSGAVCLACVAGLAWAQPGVVSQAQQDVQTLLKAIQTLYPNPKVLCSDNGSIIPSAVLEASNGMGKGALKGDMGAARRGAEQQLRQSCRL